MSVADYVIVKSNKLIESKSNFSAIENRIIALALVQIKPNDQKLRMYRIPILSVLGGKKNRSNYSHVREAAKKLIGTAIHIEEEDGWRSYAFITKAQGKYRNNYIEIEFHRDIQKFLIGLKEKYTSYTLDNVINFKRNYSLRLYELCKQYSTCGKNYYNSGYYEGQRQFCGRENDYFFRIIQLDYLRTFLALEKKYQRFNNFKITVIIPSITEINMYSDLFVEFEEIKNGTKVDAIKFIIRPNKKVHNSSQIKDLYHLDKLESFFQNFTHSSERRTKKSLNVQDEKITLTQQKKINKKSYSYLNDSISNDHEENHDFHFSIIESHSENPKIDKEHSLDFSHSFSPSNNSQSIHDDKSQNSRDLLQIGFSEEDIHEFQNTYNEEYIRLTLKLYYEKKDKILHIKSWIFGALRDDYIGYYAHKNAPFSVNSKSTSYKDKKKINTFVKSKNKEKNRLQKIFDKNKEAFRLYSENGYLSLEDIYRFEGKNSQFIIEELAKRVILSQIEVKKVEDS